MLLEKIKTPGLAHFSYLIGSNGQAAVIDPRRDCDIYIDMASRNGLQIIHVFETHRNEDLVSGSALLAGKTGATVYHGPNADGEVAYAETARDGEVFGIGKLDLKVLETPGHTDDHLAVAIYDRDYDENAVGVFTGDALFVGDVGRTDFYPDRKEEVAGLLHDSLGKILALGDQAIIYPAHGAGSVCGSNMAEREFSTVGHERANNPFLQIADRDEFIKVKTQENHYYPPYFSLMEKLNLSGASAPSCDVLPEKISAAELANAGYDCLVDIRPATSFAAAHFPGALSLPLAMISAFCGWFLEPEQRLVLVADDECDVTAALAQLYRIGFDNIAGFVLNPVQAVAGGSTFDSLDLVEAGQLARKMQDPDGKWTLLDVRSQDEVEAEPVDDATHVYVGQLNEKWQELEPDGSYTVMCGSGMRATVAASWLKARGLKNVDVYLGSPAGLKSKLEVR